MLQTTQPEFVLTDFIAPESLQALQASFARLTGISTGFRDGEGRAIVEPSEKPAFCQLMRSTASGDAACLASHAEAAQAARLADRPCETCCHAGLSQFVAPILLQGRHLSTISVGDRPKEPLDKSRIRELAKKHGLSFAALSNAAAELAPWSDTATTDATAFVQHLASTLTKLAYNAYQLQCRIDDLKAVHEIASKLAGRVGLQEILDTAVKTLVETMILRAASIRLLEPDTGVLRLAAAYGLSEEYLDKRAILAEESEIDREVLNGKTVYIRDLRSDPRNDYPEKADAEGLASVLIAPLRSGGRPIGLIRAYMDYIYEFSPFDVALMEAIAAQVASAIVNQRLRAEAQEAEQLDRQVKLAADIQRRMFPRHNPRHDHYEFGAVYQPNFDLGGDFYDFIEFEHGAVGVVIADVVGKGVPASLMMASARATLRSAAKRVDTPSEAVKEVNLRLWEDSVLSEFVTAYFGLLSADGRRLRYCNAGHEPLLLLRSGEIMTLDKGGLVLGLDPNAEYEFAEESLEPGDLLVLVTDGVIEAMNYDGDAYGRERFHSSIRLHGAMAPDMPVEMIAKQLLWDVRRFVGLAKLTDDITLVVVRVK
ncbi:MAG TPA: SpoIIE family protein phosphatase [Phycisphaerae bacterium]|nr:SpoIIE family protein phosphatase [Phycisphaerae bacterium]